MFGLRLRFENPLGYYTVACMPNGYKLVTHESL